MTGLSQAGWLARALWIETAAGNYEYTEAEEWMARHFAAIQWEAMCEVNY